MMPDDELPPEYRDDDPTGEHASIPPMPETEPAPEPAEPPARAVTYEESLAAIKNFDAKGRPFLGVFTSHEEKDRHYHDQPNRDAARAKLAELAAEMGRKIEQAKDREEALERLDLAIFVIKSIPFPEPANAIVDTFADAMRNAIRELWPEVR